MVRLIMSGKGEGKTKQLMELMNTAAEAKKLIDAVWRIAKG